MLCRAKASSVSQVGLDAATNSVLFFLTGGVSFCSGVDAPEVLDSEPKVTPPSLVYTPSDLTSLNWPGCAVPLPAHCALRATAPRRRVGSAGLPRRARGSQCPGASGWLDRARRRSIQETTRGSCRQPSPEATGQRAICRAALRSSA